MPHPLLVQRSALVREPVVLVGAHAARCTQWRIRTRKEQDERYPHPITPLQYLRIRFQHFSPLGRLMTDGLPAMLVACQFTLGLL